MSTSINFLSKDALLKRKRSGKNGTRTQPVQILSSSHTGTLLDIIPEEEDMHPKPTPRAQRRHALDVAQLRLSNITEASDEDTDFNVTFTNVSYNFPPVPTSSRASTSSPFKSFPISPLSPCSSTPSSPDSQFAGLPTTPSSSDDEFTSLPLPSPAFRFNPRRAAAIKPLVINKTQRPTTLPIIDHSDESDSEESDSEWYSKEFSKILTVDSRNPSTFFPAHRDSIFVAPTYSPPTSPTRRKRNSGLPKLSLVDAPPVPPIPSQFIALPKCNKTLSSTDSRRPPPKMSIPDDACSAFSLSLYMDDEIVPSPLSIYSQDSACIGMKENFDEDTDFLADFEVQVDCPMMLPLSLPGSPIDLEADIAHDLEKLWGSTISDEISPFTIPQEKVEEVEVEEGLGVGFILEEEEVDEPNVITPQIIIASPPSSPSIPTKLSLTLPITPPRPHRNINSPTISMISFPSPIPKEEELPIIDQDQEEQEDFDERRHGLKSKWSSSTLASIHEEHSSLTSPSKFLGSSRLKQYFQSGQHKRNHSSSQVMLSPTSPPSPPFSASTFTPISPRFSRIPIGSPIKSPKNKDKKEKEKEKKSKRESDIMVIGYNRDYYPSSPNLFTTTPTSTPPPLQRHKSNEKERSRSGSPFKRFNDSISPPASPIKRYGFGLNDFGGEIGNGNGNGNGNSNSNGTGGEVVFDLNQVGFRRKPIPVEMFLRNGL